MLKYCLKKWDANKGVLEERLKSNAKLNECDYEYLVKMVVECILNQGEDLEKWDTENITVVDNGDYQGTLLFLIPLDAYQPCEYEYLITYVGYGSCSGCDALESIQSLTYSDEPPTASQLSDYMTLCKDIVTNIIKPYNGGWRFDEDFETVEIEKNDAEG